MLFDGPSLGYSDNWGALHATCRDEDESEDENESEYDDSGHPIDYRWAKDFQFHLLINVQDTRFNVSDLINPDQYLKRGKGGKILVIQSSTW